MTSTDKVEVNVEAILKSLEFFKNKKTHLICFPENSLYFNFHKTLNKDHALTFDHPLWATLKNQAQSLGSFLHLGGVPLNDHGTIYNASVLVTPTGDAKIVYRKIHLFDVNVQGREVRESSSFAGGEHDHVEDIFGWRVGMTICYDLRFSELFVNYHHKLVDLILVPAAFLVPTGQAHWHTLLKARAIETQAFVAAAGQVGAHHSTLDGALPERQTWGESLVFSPWGECLARSPSFADGGGLTPLWLELDKSLIQKTREQIPLLSHRKFTDKMRC